MLYGSTLDRIYSHCTPETICIHTIPQFKLPFKVTHQWVALIWGYKALQEQKCRWEWGKWLNERGLLWHEADCLSIESDSGSSLLKWRVHHRHSMGASLAESRVNRLTNNRHTKNTEWQKNCHLICRIIFTTVFFSRTFLNSLSIDSLYFNYYSRWILDIIGRLVTLQWR